MRRYIIATICLVITFAVVGCGSKKGGSKASMRARSGTFDGKARSADTNTNNGDANTTADGGASNDKASTKADPCKNTIDMSINDGEEKLDGELKSLKDESSNNELVLESIEHFFEHKEKDSASQIDIKSSSFIDDTAKDAVAAADNGTEVVCENGADVAFALPNRISLKDGSYKVWRQFVAKSVKEGTDNKINSFVHDAGNVESDEYQDKATGGDKNATHIFSKDKDGNVYWRMKRTLTNPKNSEETKTFVLLAKYKQQPIAATSESAKP